MLLKGTERRGAATPRGLLPLLAAGLLVFSGCGSGGGGGSGSSAAPSQMSMIAGNDGGKGSTDGTGTAARFYNPTGIAMDRAGNIYVADSGNNIIRKITPAGVVTTFAGTAGTEGSTDGIGAAARFKAPHGLALDSADNVYVANSDGAIRKITPAGETSTLALVTGSCGSVDTITVDALGNLYLAVSSNQIICKLTPAGVVSTFAGTVGVFGNTDGAGAAASFGRPYGVVADGAGNVYVADSLNATVRKVTPAGVVTTLAGKADDTGTVDGTGSAARFVSPSEITVDSAGSLYVRDSGTIRKITSAGVVTTLVGETPADGGTYAMGASCPAGLAADAAGNVYMSDACNNAILTITSAGAVSILAGAGGYGSGDGTGIAASFDFPMGLSTDGGGNVYVADYYNGEIRKMTPEGIVTTLGGTGAAASFDRPYGVATDSAGNTYVAEPWTNVIRKVTPAGVVSILAGLTGSPGSADGVGVEARFSFPIGLATDNAGNVYVADMDNNAIRKITPAGVVTTLAATLNRPLGVAIDSAGNLYVPDSGNTLLRKISATGTVATLATTGGTPGNTVGKRVTVVGYQRPPPDAVGVAVDSVGNIYVADSGHNTVLKVTAAGLVSTLVGVSGQADFQPGTLPGLIWEPTGLVVSGNTLYFSQPGGIGRVTNLF